MVMGTGVFPQFMHSNQINAPQMNGDNGSQGQILKVLDACLITGFNQQTAVSSAISGEFITITFGVLHGYERLQYIELSGATDANFNGKKRILSVTPTTVTIAKGNVTSVEGTIVTKISPLDWESIFGSTNANQRAYRSKDLTSTRTVLYLDCVKKGTGYNTVRPMQRARVKVCRDMTTLGQQIESYTDSKDKGTDGKFHWFQAKNYSFADSNALGQNSNWTLIGDGKIFYFFVGYNNTSPDNIKYQNACYVFGDIPRISNIDTNNCVITCTEVDIQENVDYQSYSSGWNTLSAQVNHQSQSDSGGIFFIKSVDGSATLDVFRRMATCNIGNGAFSGFTDVVSINPLTLGYHYSDIIPVRVLGFIPTAPLPYIKCISNNLSVYKEQLHLKQSKDYLLVTVSPSSSSHNGNDNAYFAFNLMEERLADEA